MQHNFRSKVILITGTSSGIGESCSLYLSGRGHKVYGASRSRGMQNTLFWIKTDITREEEVKAAVEHVIAKEGRIDVLVNNSGIDLTGAIEDTSDEEAKRQFETNFFGALHLIRCVLPHMRRQGQGLIINISSIAGIIGLPYQGMYSASKFALEGVTESLRMELKGSGVQATLVDPGDTRTPITQHRITAKAALVNKAYSTPFARTMQIVANDETTGTSPEVIARLIESIILCRKVKVRYVTGKFPEKLAVTLKRILPAVLFEWMLMKKYQL